MTHFPELSGDLIKRVGWLEAGHPYARGEMTAGDVALIEQLVLRSWKPPIASNGWHDCSLCGRRPADGPLWKIIEGASTLLGASEIFVPDGEVMYEAPTLILHYIEAHRYRPPEVFVRAVRRIDPRSAEYRAACDAVARRAGMGVPR